MIRGVHTMFYSSKADELPGGAREMARKLLLDVSGLCIAARREPYVLATLARIAAASG